jgi:hypothetical protein
LDETYQIYINRVARLTLPETYQSQLPNIQPSPKFQANQAVSFPGCSVMSPPAEEDTDNALFYEHLATSQQQLLDQLDPNLIVPLPPASFHITVADLIWDQSYRQAMQENPQFKEKLKDCLNNSFKVYKQVETNPQLSQWQLVGLIIFPRALAVGLVPQDGVAYEKLLGLRRAIYQNYDLIGLGIQQQYHFTAHITLGYFSEISSDREALATTLSHFNDRWIGTDPQILTIKQVQLRNFEDMTRFERESDDPMVDL